MNRAAQLLTTGLLAAALVACGGSGGGGDASDGGDADARWSCPSGWVQYGIGGCGPAVLLCSPDGGAAEHACDGVDFTHPSDVTTTDGGHGVTFFVLADGGIGGAWPDPNSDGGPPAANWSPDAGISSCPTEHGWSAAGDGTCDPHLGTGCATGAAPLPGGRCTDTAMAACPSTPFADVSAETSSAVYVLAGSDPSSADGTVAHPDPTIAAGIARAGPGGWVLVGAGTYAESLSITAMVHVVGACAAHTVITPARGASAFDVGSPAARLDLRNVTVSAGTGINVHDRASASLTHVRIDGTAPQGIVVDGALASATLTDCVVSNVNATTTVNGAGVRVQHGAQASADQIAIVGTNGQGILVSGGSATVADSFIRGVADPLYGGSAIFVDTGSHADVQRVVAERNTAVALDATGPGARITATDVVVTGTLEWAMEFEQPGRPVGAGIEADFGATIVAERVLLDANTGFGARAYSEGTGPVSSVTIRDSVVRNGVSFRDGTGGTGITAAIAGAMLDVEGVVVDGNASEGISIAGAVSATVSDSIVRHSHPDASGAYGWGIDVEYGATLDGARLRIEDNAELAVEVSSGGDTVLTLADSVISQRDMATASFAEGVNVQCHAQANLSRVRVDGSVGVGVQAADGCPPQSTAPDPAPGTTSMGLHDCVVENGRAVDGHPDAVSGDGVAGLDGALLFVERTLVRANTAVGIAIANTTTAATLNDTAVFDTRPSPAGSYGAGVVVDQHANVSATRLYVTGAAEFGLLAIDGASADVANVIVRSVSPSSRGGGLGIAAALGASLTAQRVAVDASSGAGLGSLSADATRPSLPAQPSQLTVADAFVRSVQRSMLASDAPMTAYGLHVTTGCSLDSSHVVVDGADYGFCDVSGSMHIDGGAIAHQFDSFGANAGSGLDLVNVLGTQNASNVIVTSSTLPAAGGLAPPPLPSGCTPQGCT